MAGRQISRRLWLKGKRFLRHLSALLPALLAPEAQAESTAQNAPNPPSALSQDEPSPGVPYWSQGRARPFLSGLAIAGVGYGRLALNAGYGKPHWAWAGVEAIGGSRPTTRGCKRAFM